MKDRKPFNILLVEDNKSWLKLVKRFIEMEDSRAVIDTAGTLQDAMDKLRSGSYDQVILDLGLPGIKRHLTFQVIHKAFPKLPVLVMSGAQLNKDELASIDGADGFVHKDNVKPGFLLWPARAHAFGDQLASMIHVLVIEDDPVQARIVKEWLKEKTEAGKIKLDFAKDVDESLLYLNEPCPDCIVLDLGLPGISDLQALEAVLTRCPEAPVVVFTTQDNTIAQSCYDIGANVFLSKHDADGDSFLEAVNDAISIKKRILATMKIDEHRKQIESSINKIGQSIRELMKYKK